MELNDLFSSVGEAIVWAFTWIIMLYIGIKILISGIRNKPEPREWMTKYNKGIEMWLGGSSILGSISGLILILSDWSYWNSYSRNFMLSHEMAILAVTSGVLGIIITGNLLRKEIKQQRFKSFSEATNRKDRVYAYMRIIWMAGLFVTSPIIFLMGLFAWAPWR